MKTLNRGAEAVLYLKDGKLVKERIKKGYRLPEIDTRLRKLRTRKEAKLLSDASRAGVPVPSVSSVDEYSYRIEMNLLKGDRLKEFFNTASLPVARRAAEKAGKSVGLLHNAGMFHGDLTTSNMILKDKEVFLIDFGLGGNSCRVEDYAMDLSVFSEALRSAHFRRSKTLWDSFIKGYRQTNNNFNKVLDALNGIEKRGRYVER
jgi:Kae1-associated kinase Bud32